MGPAEQGTGDEFQTAADEPGDKARLRESLAGLGQTPPEDEAAFSDYLALLGGVMREEGCCAWLERCIALCRERLEKQ